MMGADSICDGTETCIEPSPAVLVEYDQIRGRWRAAYLPNEVVIGDAEPLFGRWCDDQSVEVNEMVQ